MEESCTYDPDKYSIYRVMNDKIPAGAGKNPPRLNRCLKLDDTFIISKAQTFIFAVLPNDLFDESVVMRGGTSLSKERSVAVAKANIEADLRECIRLGNELPSYTNHLKFRGSRKTKMRAALKLVAEACDQLDLARAASVQERMDE